MDKKNATAVIERLKELFKVTSDTALCDKAGINRQTLSNWKQRNSVPYPLCVSVAEEIGASIDWLLTGEGPMYRSAPPAPAAQLTAREEAVLAMFRALDEGAQREIQQVAEEKKRLRDVERQIRELRALLPEGKRSA